MKKKILYACLTLSLVFIAIRMDKIMKPSNDEPYEKAYQQVINDYEKYIWQKYHVRIKGLGGGATETTLRGISVFLQCRQTLTIEEGRQLFIKCFEELKTRVNSSEELRPYLETYPFTSEEFHFGLSGNSDGDVTFICLGKGDTVYYSKQIDNYTRLENVLREPYEEALKIVYGSNIANQEELSDISDIRE